MWFGWGNFRGLKVMEGIIIHKFSSKRDAEFMHAATLYFLTIPLPYCYSPDNRGDATYYSCVHRTFLVLLSFYWAILYFHNHNVQGTHLVKNHGAVAPNQCNANRLRVFRCQNAFWDDFSLTSSIKTKPHNNRVKRIYSNRQESHRKSPAIMSCRMLLISLFTCRYLSWYIIYVIFLILLWYQSYLHIVKFQ